MCKKSCFHPIVSLQTHALPPQFRDEERQRKQPAGTEGLGWEDGDSGGGSSRNDCGIPKGGTRRTLQKLGCCPPTRRSGRGGRRGTARQRAAAATWEAMGTDLPPGLIPSTPHLVFLGRILPQISSLERTTCPARRTDGSILNSFAPRFIFRSHALQPPCEVAFGCIWGVYRASAPPRGCRKWGADTLAARGWAEHAAGWALGAANHAMLRKAPNQT